MKLLIALRLYALGSIELAIADFAGVSITSVCRIMKRVSGALAEKAPEFIRMPSNEEELRESSRAFYNIARFPRTIGSIDCTHIRIQGVTKLKLIGIEKVGVTKYAHKHN